MTMMQYREAIQWQLAWLHEQEQGYRQFINSLLAHQIRSGNEREVHLMKLCITPGATNKFYLTHVTRTLHFYMTFEN